MQPSNSLIALGISAVVAASAVGSPVLAETGMRHRQSVAPKEDTNPTPASVPSPDADVSAQPPQEDQSAQTNAAESAAASDPTGSQPSASAPSNQPSQPQPTVARQRSEAQERIDNRFDRLQNESQIQQQLNQSEFRLERPSTVAPSSLQVEQEIQQQVQQQINLQDLQDNRDASTSPSRALDRLQYEQRIRQRLQQPAMPPQQPATPPDEIQAAVPEPATSEQSTPEQSTSEQSKSKQPDAPEPAATVEASKPEANSTTSADAVPADAVPADPAAATPDPAANATSNPSNAANPEATEETAKSTRSSRRAARRAAARQETARQETAQAEDTETTGDQSESKADTDAETSGAQSEQQAEDTEQSQDRAEKSKADADANETNEANETDETNETDQQAEESKKSGSRSTAEAEDRIDRLNRDYTTSPDAPAPEYLNPDPNPLSFPTEPEEVQSVGTQPLTLKQAVELAIRNNPQLRQEQFTLERTQASLREAQASNYPTVDVTANFNQTGAEATTEVPAPTETNPNQTDTTVVYQDATALGTALQVAYPIFTSGRRSALIDAAREQIRFQQLEIERQTEQLILDTTEDYYDLQQAGAQVNIFRANLVQAEQSLRDAQALERAGVGTRFDVLQAEVDVANARQDLTQQLSQLEIARQQLAQRVNLSESMSLSAADPVEVKGVWDLSLEESIVQAYKNRAELEQQLIQQEIAQQNRRAALAQLGPQITFNGSFGLDNNLDRDQRFVYNYQVGVGVQLALYDGGEARAQANQEESNIAIAQAEFENVRTQIRFSVEQAYSQLDANFANIQTTALAVEQATEALRLARLRFQAGVGTQTDVLRQQSALADAQVNNLTAILDYNRSIARLQRQVSNFPEGYLNDQP